MDHYHDMIDYKCPRCLHTFRLSNKPLHDLRCSTEFPLKLDAESYNEILNNPGLYPNSNYARRQTVPYTNINTKVFQVNNFDQNNNQQSYNNNYNYNYSNGYTIPTYNSNNNYFTQNYNTQQNYNYNYSSPSVNYTNDITNSNYDNLFSGSAISYNENTTNNYIYDVNTNNNSYSTNNYIFDTTAVTRYSNSFTSSDFYVDNTADTSSYFRNTLRESNIHEMGEYTDYDGRFKSFGGKVRGIVTLDDYKTAPEYNIYYGIEYDL